MLIALLGSTAALSQQIMPNAPHEWSGVRNFPEPDIPQPDVVPLRSPDPAVPRPNYLAENRAQIAAFEKAERSLGAANPELLPALYHLCMWYERSGQEDAARKLYRRAVTMLEAQFGKEDLHLVEPLLRIALAYQREQKFRPEGRDALERIVHLYEVVPGGDAIGLAGALIELGDWHTLNDDPDNAGAAYARAWSLLVAAKGGSKDLAAERLGTPARLAYDPYAEPPAGAVKPAPPAGAAGSAAAVDAADSASPAIASYMTLEFTVLPTGKVEDVSVLETTASSRVTRQVSFGLAQAHYRPAWVDGRATTATRRLKVQFTADPNEPAKNEGGGGETKSAGADRWKFARTH